MSSEREPGFWCLHRRSRRAAELLRKVGEERKSDHQDWLYKDEMSAAVKLGGGCAALARMQAVWRFWRVSGSPRLELAREGILTVSVFQNHVFFAGDILE